MLRYFVTDGHKHMIGKLVVCLTQLYVDHFSMKLSLIGDIVKPTLVTLVHICNIGLASTDVHCDF